MDRWQKRGDQKVVAKKFGKLMVSQNFINPRNGDVEEYIMIGQKDWSIVLAVTQENQILVVNQYKQGCDKVITELPAGTTNFEGEAPELVIERELLQETGYQAQNIIRVGPPQWIASRSSWTRFHPFLATGCKQVAEQRLDITEEIEMSHMPLKAWIDQIFAGKIDEPSSITTTFLALPHLGINLQFPE